jgi:glycosyltransferase involved in cell wall biosynthesis
MKELVVDNFKASKDRVFVIPHTLPEEYYVPPPGECRCSTSMDAINLVFVGDMTIRHNVDAVRFLLRILSYVKAYVGRPFTLHIVGRVNDTVRSMIERLVCDYGLERHVRLWGYVEDIDEVLCCMDVLLAPMFTMSGVSTKMLFYLRFKDKIILASKEAVEGLEHLAERHGHVIIAETPADIAIKLYKVLKNA